MATVVQNNISLDKNTNTSNKNEGDVGHYRSPPHNFEAEKALLGAIFANNNAFDRVAGYLRPEHFADPIHGKIFDSIYLSTDSSISFLFSF